MCLDIPFKNSSYLSITPHQNPRTTDINDGDTELTPGTDHSCPCRGYRSNIQNLASLERPYVSPSYCFAFAVVIVELARNLFCCVESVLCSLKCPPWPSISWRCSAFMTADKGVTRKGIRPAVVFSVRTVTAVVHHSF